MTTLRIGNVPLIPQYKTGSCWYASASMLAGWRIQSKGGLGPMTHPNAHSDTKDMYKRNAALLAVGSGALKRWLGMKEISVPASPADWVTTLSKTGPLWAAGNKHWMAGYGHVVVVYGAAETGLLINDPEPISQGKEEWRSWASMNKFFAESESEVKLLSCP